MKISIFLLFVCIPMIGDVFASEKEIGLYDFSRLAEDMCREPDLYGYNQSAKGEANIDIALLIKKTFGANADIGGHLSKQEWLNVPQKDLLAAIQSRQDCVIKALKLLLTIHQNLSVSKNDKAKYGCYNAGDTNKCVSDELLLGKWMSSYAYDQTTGPIKIKGVTEYFKTGNYNYQGNLEADYLKTNATLEFDLRITGKWTLIGSELFIETVDRQSTLTSIRVDGELHSMNHNKQRFLFFKEYLAQKPDTSLDKALLIGQTDSMKIITIDGSKKLIENEDLEGKPFRFLSYRVD